MVAIPSIDGKISIEAAISLIREREVMAQYGGTMGVLHLAGCSMIEKARNRLVRSFLDTAGTDLMFVDADIEWTPGAITALAIAATRRDIVGGLYLTKGADQVFKAKFDYLDGKVQITEDGCVFMERIPTGFMLIRRHVLEALSGTIYREDDGKDTPLIFRPRLVGDQYIGEDYAFCDDAREKGFSVCIMPSVTLGHVGTFRHEGNFLEQVLQPMLEKQGGSD